MNELTAADWAILWRAMHAAFRSGGNDDASALADIALNPVTAPHSDRMLAALSEGWTRRRRSTTAPIDRWMHRCATSPAGGVPVVRSPGWRWTRTPRWPPRPVNWRLGRASLDDTMLMANLSDPAASSRDRIASLRHLHRDEARRAAVLNVR